MQDHVEGYLELAAKTKSYFSTAVSTWDADYYVKVDDDVHVNIGAFNNCRQLHHTIFNLTCNEIQRFMNIAATLGGILARHRSKPRVYIGCMKSGPVLAQK